MSNTPRRLTRQQIAGISSDPRVVRVIEQLIDTANDAYDMASAAQAELDVYTTPLALDIQIRDASYALPTTPTVIMPQTVASQRGITYDPTTGIITLPQARQYSTFTVMNTSLLGSKTIYTYAEINVGAGWVASTYSGREISVPAQADGQVQTVSRNYFPAGTQLRFPLYASSAGVNLVSVNLPGTTPGTVIAPAYRIMIAA